LTAEEARGIASAFSSDEATLETLHRQSDGWAAGLTLMLERVRRNGIAPGRLEAETREAVFNYFAGEILDRASSEDRHILVSTAFLPSMTAAIAEQVSGSPRASQLLHQLYRRQLFTNCCAGTPPNYQYHDLFREFLLPVLLFPLVLPILVLASRITSEALAGRDIPGLWWTAFSLYDWVFALIGYFVFDYVLED
jgi:ATP/maltotriose-dependent transcriptional regulator MalT